jgi:hypothetical protein
MHQTYRHVPIGSKAIAEEVKMEEDKEVNKNVKIIFLSMCDVRVFLTFTPLNLVLL